jgi:hypothetical protein
MPNELIALIVAEIAKEVPALAIDIIEVLKAEGTPEQWAALRARWNRPAASFYTTPPPPVV